MQNFLKAIASLSLLWIFYLIISKQYPNFLSGDINNFLGGVGGFTFPIITSVLSFLVGGSEKASTEVGKGVRDRVNNIITQIGLWNNATINNGITEKKVSNKESK
jgi:hypothetical protein